MKNISITPSLSKFLLIAMIILLSGCRSRKVEEHKKAELVRRKAASKAAFKKWEQNARVKARKQKMLRKRQMLKRQQRQKLLMKKAAAIKECSCGVTGMQNRKHCK